MKIYFASSIRGGRRDAPLYQKIIELLKSLGHEVLTECLNNFSIAASGSQDITDEQIFERDSRWIRECELFIAEVTQTSLGVGYQIGYAEDQGKRVICLYRPRTEGRLSAIIHGNKNLTVYQYEQLDDLKGVLPKLIAGEKIGV